MPESNAIDAFCPSTDTGNGDVPINCTSSNSLSIGYSSSLNELQRPPLICNSLDSVHRTSILSFDIPGSSMKIFDDSFGKYSVIVRIEGCWNPFKLLSKGFCKYYRYDGVSFRFSELNIMGSIYKLFDTLSIVGIKYCYSNIIQGFIIDIEWIVLRVVYVQSTDKRINEYYCRMRISNCGKL